MRTFAIVITLLLITAALLLGCQRGDEAAPPPERTADGREPAPAPTPAPPRLEPRPAPEPSEPEDSRHVQLLGPDDGATLTAQQQDLRYRLPDHNTIANCSLIINEQAVRTHDGINRVTNQFGMHLRNGTYTWQIFCILTNGSVARTEERIFLVALEEPRPTPEYVFYREGSRFTLPLWEEDLPFNVDAYDLPLAQTSDLLEILLYDDEHGEPHNASLHIRHVFDDAPRNTWYIVYTLRTPEFSEGELDEGDALSIDIDEDGTEDLRFTYNVVRQRVNFTLERI